VSLITPLHYAAEAGDVQSVTAHLLIKNEANVNAINNARETPLNLAVRYGTINTIEELIKKGADVDIKDKYGKTPLDWAFEKGDAKIIEALQSAAKKRKGSAVEESNKGQAAKSSRTTGTGFAIAVKEERGPQEGPAGGTAGGMGIGK